MRIPNMLPFFFTALKVGATLAFIGAIVGEYFGGTSEVLGRVVLTSMSSGSYDLAWAAILIGAIARDRRVPGRLARRARGHPWHARVALSELTPASAIACAIVARSRKRAVHRPRERLDGGTSEEERPLRRNGRWRG